MSSHTLLLAQQRIAERRAVKAVIDAKIAALQQENEKVDLAIVVWEEVLRDLMSDMPTASADAAVISTNTATEPSDRRRGPKGMWKKIMPRMVAQYPDSDFALSDVQDAGVALTGTSININTARSQMWHYAKDGHIERSGTGRYRFTQAGLNVFGSLSNTPDADKHPETSSPAAGDAQAAGDYSPDDVESVNPEASANLDSIGRGSSR